MGGSSRGRGWARSWLLGWACLLAQPGLAQSVTFEVYPPQAVIFREAPGVPEGREAIGRPGQAVQLAEVGTQNQVTVIIADPSGEARQPWREVFQNLDLHAGEQRTVQVYLAPRAAWRQLLDPWRYWSPWLRGLTALAGSLAFGSAWVWFRGRPQRAQRRAAQERAWVLQQVGAEYERRFGPWLAVGRLGSGGMGEVLRAFPADQVRLSSQVALKLLGSSEGGEAVAGEDDPRRREQRARFALETRVLCALRHPGIVTLLDFGEWEGQSYYVMELVEGESLQSYLDRRPRPPYGEVRDLFRQLLAIVGFAHRQGVLHRDLKPLNVLRQPNGRLKVIDFGLARDQNQTIALTQCGMPFAGSLEYMDPRVALQMFGQAPPSPSDPGTDQFALGAMLYLMLTGKAALELPATLDAQGLLPVLSQLAQPRPPARQHRPDLPESLERVVATMMALRVEDRYPTLDAAGVALERAMATVVA